MPHFRTWDSTYYDFHTAADQSDNTKSGLSGTWDVPTQGAASKGTAILGFGAYAPDQSATADEDLGTPNQDFGGDVFVFNDNLLPPETETSAELQGMALIIDEDTSDTNPDAETMTADTGALPNEGNILIISEDFAAF